MKDDRSREELLHENEALRRELLEKRTNRSMWPVALGLLVHLVLRPFCDPWLNAESDAKVATALTILLLPIVFSVGMLVRILRRRV